MTLTNSQRQTLLGGLVVLLIGSVFLLSSLSQETEEQVPEEAVATPLPDRAPEGYRVPERPPVVFPFTNVSADRLRLGTVRTFHRGDYERENITEGDLLPLATYLRQPLSPDGQWIVGWARIPERYKFHYAYHVVRIDGSGEKKMVLREGGTPDGTLSLSSFPGSRFTFASPTVWSWDSSRVFYQVHLDRPDPDKDDGWLESFDVATGQVTRHTDINRWYDIRSYATARYPDDPIIYRDYERDVDAVQTKDGTKHWALPDGGFLSPNKRLVLSWDGWDDAGKPQYLVYGIEGNGPQYRFPSVTEQQHSMRRHMHLYDTDRFIWSPDSTKIAYTLYWHNEGAAFASEIYIMNIDGTDKTQLTDTPDIIEDLMGWTEDGSIVFTDKGVLYVADLIVE